MGRNAAQSSEPCFWRWMTVVTLALPLLVLFWPIVVGGRVLFWGTPLLQFIPWSQAAAAMIDQGDWPLWNSWVGNGAPLLANYQSALLYPPNWLNLVLPPARSLSWSMVFHVIWAGVGMLGYTRALGFRPFSRLISALAFMYSGFLISRLGFGSMGSTYPWLPWVFWAAEQLWQRPSKTGAVRLAACLGLQWLAGHAQLSFHTGLALVGYLGWRTMVMSTRLSTGRKLVTGLWSRLSWTLAAVVLAAGLAAAQLAPTAELLHVSQRAHGVDGGPAMTYSLWPYRLIAFVAPRFFGHPATGDYWGYCCNYWEDNGYLGLLPLLLAAVAIGAWVRDGRRRKKSPGESSDSLRVKAPNIQLIPFFGLLSLVAVILALGVHTPVYPWLFRNVPGWSQFQAPARFLSLWTWAVAVLAGFGAEHWRPTRRARAAARYGVVVGLALVVAAAVSVSMLRGMPITFSAGAAQLGGGLIAIALIALLQPWATGQSRHLVWSAAALLLLAADLVAASWGANPTAEAWLAERPTVSGAALRDAGLDGRSFYLEADSYAVTFGRYLSFRDFGPRDTGYWFALRETLLPNMGILDGVASANNFDPLLSGRYADLLRMVNRAPGDERARLLQMMGVQVLISQVPEADFALVHANQNVTLAAVPDPFPRAYWIGSAEPVADAAAAAGSVADPSTDLRRVVVLEGAPPVSADQVARHELVPLEVEATNNRATVQAHAPVGGYVVLLDTYFPGWVAAVDGRPAPIYPANLAFRAVSVPAGQHMVEFTYRPFTVRAGAALSALCWLAVAGVVVLSRRPIAGRRNAEAGKTRPAGLTGQDAPGRMADLLRRVDDE